MLLDTLFPNTVLALGIDKELLGSVFSFDPDFDREWLLLLFLPLDIDRLPLPAEYEGDLDRDLFLLPRVMEQDFLLRKSDLDLVPDLLPLDLDRDL